MPKSIAKRFLGKVCQDMTQSYLYPNGTGSRSLPGMMSVAVEGCAADGRMDPALCAARQLKPSKIHRAGKPRISRKMSSRRSPRSDGSRGPVPFQSRIEARSTLNRWVELPFVLATINREVVYPTPV
jgi:hypothetical protein